LVGLGLALGVNGLGGFFSIRARTASRELSGAFGMAGQPLSSLDPKAGYSFGIDILERHPELASYIAQTISIGSIIERRWSAILVQLLQADPLTGMAMYQALTSTVAQRAALGAAAKVRLSPEDFKLFQAVATAITPARKIRNDFAHHIWGESALVPGGLS